MPTKCSEFQSHFKTIKVLDSSHSIYKIFEENFSEGPLKLKLRNLHFRSVNLH